MSETKTWASKFKSWAFDYGADKVADALVGAIIAKIVWAAITVVVVGLIAGAVLFLGVPWAYHTLIALF
jgi:hypothetical protein